MAPDPADIDLEAMVIDALERLPEPFRANTKLEFDVMSYLFQRKGTVVKRSELLRDVWGYEDAGGSNVIEANVRSLRRKLGDRAASIETVRGIGYRFQAPT